MVKVLGVLERHKGTPDSSRWSHPFVHEQTYVHMFVVSSHTDSQGPRNGRKLPLDTRSSEDQGRMEVVSSYTNF